MNYIFQKKNYNSYQCGAYAIYNALQKHNYKNKNITLKSLIRKCKARKGIGTLVSDFNAALESIQISIKPSEATLCTVRDTLKATPLNMGVGGAQPLIILFHWYQGAHKGNHYALIDKVYYKYGSYSYRVINYSFDKPIHIISERELKSMLMPYEDEHFNLPRVWTI
jgi:hypothetical protein